MKQSVRIGIDCRLAGKQHAGIGRYIENLVQRLEQHPGITWVLFFYNQQQATEVLPNKQQRADKELRFVAIQHYSLQEQIQLPAIFAAAKLDLLHVPHFNVPLLYQGDFILTIHDLLWHERKGLEVTTLPWWQYGLKYLAYRFVASKAIHKAKAIIVPSKTIEKTLTSYYPAVTSKVTVITEGANKLFLNHSNKATAANKRKNLLYVGSLYPHKNIGLVFKALEKLPEYHLDIVCARSVFRDSIERNVHESTIEKQVAFLGFVNDSELRRLYQKASALIQPSLSEGFGLTGIEAMAVGTPVLASNIPIFKEIYADAAIYFDPQSTKSFIQAVRKLEGSSRNILVQRGKKQAKQYSWDKMVEQTVQLYQSLLVTT